MCMYMYMYMYPGPPDTRSTDPEASGATRRKGCYTQPWPRTPWLWKAPAVKP